MIQAITVSVNYADFLAETLPYLVKAVDRVVVVTSLQDTDTREVAYSCGAHCVRTDAFTRDGAVFRKGLAIDEGIRSLGDSARVSWLLHIDADIALFDKLYAGNLDKSAMYGCERYCVRGRRAWEELQAMAKRDAPLAPQDAPWLRPHKRPGRRGGRIVPPGFFQLWYGGKRASYPSESPDASKDDITHSMAFKKCKVIEDIKVYHLESDDHDLRVNWSGRVTSKF